MSGEFAFGPLCSYNGLFKQVLSRAVLRHGPLRARRDPDLPADEIDR